MSMCSSIYSTVSSYQRPETPSQQPPPPPKPASTTTSQLVDSNCVNTSRNSCSSSSNSSCKHFLKYENGKLNPFTPRKDSAQLNKFLGMKGAAGLVINSSFGKISFDVIFLKTNKILLVFLKIFSHYCLIYRN